jgi:hypothetical protein
MKRIIFLTFLLPFIAYSQNGVSDLQLPQVLPATPDVTAIVKGGEVSSNPHSGAASASIPITEIKLKGFSLPISLSYYSTGMKVEEIPSRVGIGWNLNVGGVVSRIVKGKPDDESTVMTPLTPAQIATANQQTLTYLESIADNGSTWDSQPDEFRFNVMGLSGKFYILANGNVLQTAYSNLKIFIAKDAYNKISCIRITDDKGNRYSFGEFGKYEYTYEHSLKGPFLNKNGIRTAWYLTSIELADGGKYDFSYTAVDIYTKTGISQSLQKGITNGSEMQCFTPGNPNFPTFTFRCPSDAIFSEKINFIKYKAYYLGQITCSNGTSVYFGYESRPDNSGDVRLKTIQVVNSWTGSVVKKAELFYSNTIGDIDSDDINKRFFLNEVAFSNSQDNSDKQRFQLDYISKESVPTRTSFSVDHLGFFNGAGNNTLLPSRQSIPESEIGFWNLTYPEMFDGYGTADRKPHGDAAKTGMLSKITYPTGGSEEFVYEPNMKTYWDSVDVENVLTAKVNGPGAYPDQVYNVNFTVSRQQVGELFASSQWLNNSLPPSTTDLAAKVAFVTLYDDATGDVITTGGTQAKWIVYGYTGFTGYLLEGNSGSRNVRLLPGIQYRLELVVRNGPNNYATAQIVYDAGNQKIWKEVNEELCGVRVKQIKSYDPVTNKTISKFYRYRSLTDTIHPSAQVLYQYNYVSNTESATAIPCIINGVKYCEAKVLSSTSSIALYLNASTPVAYKWVIESNNQDWIEGGTEHTFLTVNGVMATPILNYPIQQMAIEPFDDMNGKQLQTKIFNSQKNTVKLITNHYSTDSRISLNQPNNYIVRKRYEPPIVQSPITLLNFKHLDVSYYEIFTHWDHLDYTETIDYSVGSSPIVTRVDYAYSPQSSIVENTAPTEVVTTNSLGNQVKSVTKYPNEFSTNPVCASMIARNMIAIPIQEESYQANNLLYKTVTIYSDWFNDQKILKPENLARQKSSTGNLDTRIRFYNYDDNGKPTCLSKENDVKIGYIYDRESQLPIAECMNVSGNNSFAYTSFETSETGNWQYTGTGDWDNSAPTGLKSYSLKGERNSIYLAITLPQNFVITFWLKDDGGTAYVNDMTPNVVLIKNGWKLCQFSYSDNPEVRYEGIIISGSGIIDELRLRADNALLKTFCYSPEIGVISTADQNNKYLRYEYDGFNRLATIYDWDANIIKKFDYGYKVATTPCPNMTPNWQATGNTRCAKNNPINNASTGYREREERDLNTCSPTYLQYRWIVYGTTSSSGCHVENCTGQGKRWINGNCETGIKIISSSKYLGNLLWECSFHYLWSDGFTSPEYTVTGGSPCGTQIQLQP